MHSYKLLSQTDDKSSTLSDKKLGAFDPEDYYYKTDTQIKINNQPTPGIKLKYTGSALAARYYGVKYKTEIIIPNYRQFYTLNVLTWGNKKTIQERLNNLLKKARQNQNSEHRQAFLFGCHSSHSVPVVYLREDNQEALLIADSYYSQEILAKKLALNCNIDIFAVPAGRQKDTYSCHTECLIFARDTTRRNTDNQYYIKKLLSKLKSRATKLSENCFSVKLPDKLLKTAQTKKYVYLHKESKNPIVHTRSLDEKKITETLSEFRARYNDANATHKNAAGENVTATETAAYLRIKALKMANIIQIQFYIEQLEQLLGTLWTPAWREAFIRESKKTLHTQGLATNNREGLLMLATTFADKIKSKINSNGFFIKAAADSKPLTSENSKICVIQ